MNHLGTRLVRFFAVGVSFLLIGSVALTIDMLLAIPRRRAFAELRFGLQVARTTIRTEWRLATGKRAIFRRYNNQ
ncbi:hypothetical protein [Cupriavidus metallidurans]|uniref:hypothetical protein n=1 Tax=Cupriavidus metallidurans TaxID=119219 RepID=UPI001CCAFA73|nr:hypothetical protein [Cupriavidus metallidurans]UBM12688.1 hypothetical protein LAI70_28150 [Cupriavidus metallidurans]